MTSKTNRPSWRLPKHGGPKNRTFSGYISRFGDGHPSRVRCKAIARTTGERCRRDALQGAVCCQAHGGHRQAYKNAPAGFISSVKGKSAVRKALAKLSTIERFPVGVPYPDTPVKRGKAIETARNRQLGLTRESF
jgi:hypothetical protein